jgi:hypothetical protein
MRRHPHQGMPGSKPRLPRTNGKLSKAKFDKLSEEYMLQRNAAIRTKNQREQMELAMARGELISKRLAVQQATFLTIAARQKLLAIPQIWCRRLASVDVAQASKILREMSLSILAELKDLPNAVAPGWLDELAQDPGPQLESEDRPLTPTQAKAKARKR